jgi:phosphoribosylformimino-5-aminoimidazole carboxamide ribotide isomerase
MRVVPVLDVRDGEAVHAVAGQRAHYAPLRSALATGTADPLRLGRAFRERLALETVYLADLDAIGGTGANVAVVRDVVALGAAVWLDAGARDAGDAEQAAGLGVDSVVLGLETLRGPAALGRCVAAVGPAAAVWSLDLRAGRPVVSPGADWGTDDPLDLADRAVARGVRRAIVLDLARVGTGGGVAATAALVAQLRARHPAVAWAAGGGVAGADDLEMLARAGAAAALVGSALHDGRLDAAAVGRWNGLAETRA